MAGWERSPTAALWRSSSKTDCSTDCPLSRCSFDRNGSTAEVVCRSRKPAGRREILVACVHRARAVGRRRQCGLPAYLSSSTDRCAPSNLSPSKQSTLSWRGAEPPSETTTPSGGKGLIHGAPSLRGPRPPCRRFHLRGHRLRSFFEFIQLNSRDFSYAVQNGNGHLTCSALSARKCVTICATRSDGGEKVIFMR